jgi:FixJ family two-component response regulator
MIEEMNMVAINREAAAVYLLDDDASILKANRRLLDSAGWDNVEIFTDPIAFLEHAARHRPELAVIDIFMPEMNGLEVQTRLRRVSPSTRVIVLTAQDDPSIRRIAMNAGAAAFFSKGVESDDFLAVVKTAADSGN